MRLKESELNNRLHIFNNKDVVVSIREDFKTRFELYNLQIRFNNYNGILYIADYSKKNYIKINITTVCSIKLENEILKIQLDNSVIKIKNKNRRWIYKWIKKKLKN